MGLWVCLLFFKTGSASTVPISESTCLLVARHKATTATGAASVKQRQPSGEEASPGQSANICFQFILAMSPKLWTEAGMLIIPQVSTSTVDITHYGLTHSSITRLGHTLVGEPKTKEDDSDDWLHRNPTYVRGARSAEHNSNVLRTGSRSAEHNSNVLQAGGEHGQHDFVPTSFIFSPSIESQGMLKLTSNYSFCYITAQCPFDMTWRLLPYVI